MKKTIFALLLAIVLMSTTEINAAAEESRLLCRVVSQKDHEYDVIAELSGNNRIAMMQFCIYYDSEKLSCSGIEVGTIFQGNLAPTINAQIPGEIALSWDSLTSLQSEGTLLLLHMQLLGDESASLSFGTDDECVFADEDFTPINISCIGCRIEKTPIATVVNTTENPSTSDAPLPQDTTITFLTPDPKAVATPDAEQYILENQNESLTLSEGESNGLTLPEGQVVIHISETFPMAIQEDETNLVWSSSNERIATVDANGVVSAHEEGTAIITVSTEEGLDYASCAVKVERDNTAGEAAAAEAQEIPQEKADDILQPLQKQENLLTTDNEEPIASRKTKSSSGVYKSDGLFIAAVFFGIVIVLLIIRAGVHHRKNDNRK